MVETRSAPRYRVIKPAHIEHGGDKIACTVRDLSITGAALEVSDSTGIPAKFTLARGRIETGVVGAVAWSGRTGRSLRLSRPASSGS
ncbi:MAG: PilZ domain-containing protein [Alphaproteobacteria bacterium]|nr:MAG: PilZ domain-containing protein [Alphaproteobacteria bacterium]